MENVDLSVIANIVTIAGGIVGLALVILETVETWLNIHEKIDKSVADKSRGLVDRRNRLARTLLKRRR